MEVKEASFQLSIQVRGEWTYYYLFNCNILMGDKHIVVSGQGRKVSRAKSTLSSPSICLMRHKEGENSVLLALLTWCPCPETT